MFALHTFFWFALAEQRRSNGFERLVLLLAGVLLVMALGVFADHVLRMNLSLRGANLNQLTYLAGLEIYRAGGFFQDPQRAGAFLATLVTFLLVLTLRGRFASPKIRAAIWLAIVAGLAALPLTMSRGAILACLAVSALALFVFNAWHTHVKVLVAALSITVALVVTQTSFDVWLDVLPTTMRERFLRIGEEFASRWFIWFDTWEMFAEQPLTGIGLGSFRSYLLETRPGTFNYYGIGAAAGVPYVPDQPESGYLKILYEGGLLGSLAALLVAGEAVRRGLAVIADRAASSTARTECIAALAGLTTFGLTFVTLFTIGDARLGALLALLLAVIWHRSLERAGARRV
jgi:O-antigen ligase